MSYYSFEWAKNVYETFSRHYARAANMLMDFCGKTDRFLIECLQYHQNAWELLKIIIKNLDREISFCPEEIIRNDSDQLVEACILDQRNRILMTIEKVSRNEKQVLTTLFSRVKLSLDGIQGESLQGQLW